MSEDVVHKVAAGGFTELQQALLGTESVEQFLRSLRCWPPAWWRTACRAA
jgi:hypothetical protein